MRFDAIIFDFDGVLLESEYEGSRMIAQLLTELGHPMGIAEAVEHFTGRAGKDFIAAVEQRIGRPVPPEFHEQMKRAGARALEEGLESVAGAIDFVRSLPSELPKAVASSSSTRWIRGHLEHLGIAGIFGDHLYSGREHVENGKPAPDLYLYAADQIGADIRRTVILEDSKVGVTGALASGATVIGLAAGSHCLDGHADKLRSVGPIEIAHNFDEVARLVGLQESR